MAINLERIIVFLLNNNIFCCTRSIYYSIIKLDRKVKHYISIFEKKKLKNNIIVSTLNI